MESDDRSLLSVTTYSVCSALPSRLDSVSKGTKYLLVDTSGNARLATEHEITSPDSGDAFIYRRAQVEKRETKSDVPATEYKKSTGYYLGIMETIPSLYPLEQFEIEALTEVAEAIREFRPAGLTSVDQIPKGAKLFCQVTQEQTTELGRLLNEFKGVGLTTI